MNASYNIEMTNKLRVILNDISVELLKEGVSIIVVENYRLYTEILTLMAKQVNLCESCTTLLENGMEQEAFILARSQFNNMLWIKYLLADDDGSRLKEYLYQPLISRMYADKNLLKILQNDQLLDEKFKEPLFIENINNRINEAKDIIAQENLEKKPKSISDLAKDDNLLFEMYVTYYHEGSKVEHSDVSVNQNYRKQILEEYPADQIFKIDISTSNKEMWYRVFDFTNMSLFFSYEAIVNKLMLSERQLFENLHIHGTKAMYDEEKLKMILLKFAELQLVRKQDTNR